MENINIIGFNMLAFLIAYLFGALNTSIIASRKMLNEDIRKSGSGNAGATNMARRTGFGGGMLISFIDWTKVVFIALIFWVLKEKVGHGFETVYIQLVAFGVLVGHIWPIFFKFKGGKGVSAFLGFTMSWNVIAGLIVIIAFWFIVYLVDKISFSSIACTILVVVLTFIPWFNNGVLTTLMKSGVDMNSINYWITTIISILISIIIISKHHQNITRLLNGEESSFRVSILKKEPGCKLFKKIK